jgi:alpha-tubulin suppressor-like RCC1 family protein
MDQPRTVDANFGKYPRPVGSITVTPSPLILEEGDKGTLTATIRDPEGTILTDRPFTWASMRPTSVSVSPSGEVTGIVEDDTTWVSATSEYVTGNGSVVVLAPEFRALNVGVGADHTCAYRKLNAVHCWGNAGSGRLGNPENPGGGPRIHVIGGRALIGADGGAEHTCALAAQLVLYCWGSGDNGELGDGLQTDSPVPVRVASAGQLGFAYAAGGAASCATTNDDQLYCWGANPEGVLGVGSSEPTVSTPARVVGGLSVFKLDVGAGHVCVITHDSHLYCWGRNASGQLGTGDLQPRTAPFRITGGLPPTVWSVATGTNHSCVADFTGAVWCWGLNDKGQLGDGTKISRTAPTRVTTPIAFGLVTAGAHHTCARTLSADTYCWGDNSLGQLGDGTTISSSVPVRVATGLKFFSTKAGANHTCGVTVENVLRCWGSNLSGQLGVSGVTFSKVPVAVPRP